MRQFYQCLLTSLFFLSVALRSNAERFSYVYIQGDKQTPFYVKLEDEMLPRYSKNYYIIPQLAAGPIHIQVLFQQNEFPPLNFTVQVPDNGYRGFLLTRKDNAFALYDIQQRFYLMPGDAGEDHLPEMITTPVAVVKRAPKTAADKVKVSEKAGKKVVKPVEKPPVQDQPFDPAKKGEPQFLDNIELENDHIVAKQDVREPIAEQEASQSFAEAPTEETTEVSPETVAPATTTPESIREAEKAYLQKRQTAATTVNIANETAVEETPVVSPVAQSEVSAREAEKEYYRKQSSEAPSNVSSIQVVEEPARAQDIATAETAVSSSDPASEPIPSLINSSPAIINSDCPSAIDDKKFDGIYNSTRGKQGDDKKVTFLMKQASSNCFSTRQAFLLARQLQAESMRYSFLKKVYARVMDQQNFPMLGEQLFKTLEWKSYFRLIYEP